MNRPDPLDNLPRVVRDALRDDLDFSAIPPSATATLVRLLAPYRDAAHLDEIPAAVLSACETMLRPDVVAATASRDPIVELTPAPRRSVAPEPEPRAKQPR